MDTADKAAVQRVGETNMASTKCLSESVEEAHLLSGKIEAMTANTRERAKRYLAYNTARSGSVTELPNRDTCEK